LFYYYYCLFGGGAWKLKGWTPECVPSVFPTSYWAISVEFPLLSKLFAGQRLDVGNLFICMPLPRQSSPDHESAAIAKSVTWCSSCRPYKVRVLCNGRSQKKTTTLDSHCTNYKYRTETSGIVQLDICHS
jgi:hypothetical protein